MSTNHGVTWTLNPLLLLRLPVELQVDIWNRVLGYDVTHPLALGYSPCSPCSQQPQSGRHRRRCRGNTCRERHNQRGATPFDAGWVSLHSQLYPITNRALYGGRWFRFPSARDVAEFMHPRFRWPRTVLNYPSFRRDLTPIINTSVGSGYQYSSRRDIRRLHFVVVRAWPPNYRQSLDEWADYWAGRHPHGSARHDLPPALQEVHLEFQSTLSWGGAADHQADEFLEFNRLELAMVSTAQQHVVLGRVTVTGLRDQARAQSLEARMTRFG